MVGDSRRNDVQVFVITFRKFRAQLSSVGFLGKDIWFLSPTNKIPGVEAPVASEGWAYGRLVLADDRRSPPGWYPQAYAQ